MRIAHFVQRYPPALGGSEAYFARLSQFLASAGDRVAVYTTTAIDLEAFWRRDGRCLPAGTASEHRVEVRRYPLLRWPGRRYLLKALSLWPNRLWQCLTIPCNPIAPSMWTDAGKPVPEFDVVHATAFPYGWPLACGLRLARRQNLPLCLTPFLHLGDPDDPHDRTRRGFTAPSLVHLLHAADRIFVQTELERDALLAMGFSGENLVLQGMGVDPGECTGGNREQARRHWGIGADVVVVGHLANLSEEKGSVDLLRAAELAWRQGEEFRIVLAGPKMPNFTRFWDAFAGKDRVRLLGVLTDQQKRDFFAGIDVFALPSRSDSFGLVILEAWANGVPSIAYRAGGPLAVIRHEKDGVLVRCGDLTGLAAAVSRLVKEAWLRCRLGRAGRERLLSQFCWDDKLQLVRQVYEELVARPRTPASSRSRGRVV